MRIFVCRAGLTKIYTVSKTIASGCDIKMDCYVLLSRKDHHHDHCHRYHHPHHHRKSVAVSDSMPMGQCIFVTTEFL